MKKQENSINVRIFYALKVAEKSEVPLLIMSNPGMGKTTTIVMYGKLRNMDVVCLQGNAETAEAIHGYETVSTAPVKPGEVVISSRTRPSWMNRILENQRNGKKTILFLDEITTANEFVQSALLKLIFDRTCGVEKLPPVEECLIVSAGNYINNLTSSMTILAPLMNRFMIYNITPTVNDLPCFLNKYAGALSGSEVVDPMVQIEGILKELDSQESTYDEATKSKIGEYFERSILETAKMLITMSGKVDLSITDLKNIYGDVDDEDPTLYGFITPRSLCYLRDVAVACYISFGEEGIKSDNFKQMINGLCGIGLTKEKKSSTINIKTNKIGQEFYISLSQVATELSKLSSDALPEYVNYFSGVIKGVKSKDRPKNEQGKFSNAELNALKNKIEAMNGDSKLDKLKKPLEADLITELGQLLIDTSSIIPKGGKFNTTSGDDKSEVVKNLKKNGLDVSVLAGYVSTWNMIADLYNSLRNFVRLDKWEYDTTTKESLDNVGSQISTTATSLKVYKRIFLISDPGASSIIPEITPTKTN